MHSSTPVPTILPYWDAGQAIGYTDCGGYRYRGDPYPIGRVIAPACRNVSDSTWFAVMTHIVPPSVTPIPELSAWATTLDQIASKPLEFCPDFPAIAARYEAWWNQSLVDRPIIQASYNTKPERPITRRLELLEDGEAWFAAKLQDLKQTRYLGDALPHIRADFGPVLLGGMLGGRLEFGADTGWTHAFIDDTWSNAPDWVLREDNAWWRLLRERAEQVARDAAGRYVLCTPDLGGSADVLLNLRGASNLCLDVLTQPERIPEALNAIYPAWHEAISMLYRTATDRGAGLAHWLGVWSSEPYMVPACDFNFLIGQHDFERLCLPDIARQAATVGRAVFHLDGPGAAKHIDALLEVPDIQAIQFTPGEGTPSALAWVEMFRKIQDKGRSLLVFCPPREVLELCGALRPEGLAILVLGEIAPIDLEDLYGAFCQRFGC
jgi:hypothetical protein